VVSFDDRVGLGTVRCDEGVEFEFHAVEIVGGARTIEVGRRVAFGLLPRFGRMQAARLRPL
jgi:cold shock CspA family protein